MCGFAGILTNRPSTANQTQAILTQMGNRLAHRGPDDSQLLVTEQVGLVFRRLSIVDIANGSQPLTNEDGSLVLVVNGEIYNHLALRALLKGHHEFKSRSDCEIILHLYEEMGEQFLQHLNGMFALALWDKRRKRVLIARDRLGIKPLYYHHSPERLIFGSEMKALFVYPDCPREIDWHAALSFSMHQPATSAPFPNFFKGILSLKGGDYLQVELASGKLQQHTYWRLPQLSAAEYAADTRSLAQLTAGYQELLTESVNLQLMSDAGIGLFLSGGIDSVSIAQIASKVTKLPTFTVFSQSTFKNGDVEAAAAASQYLGLDNHQVLFQWQDNQYDETYWKRLLWHLETPLCSAEHLYKYELHRYAKQHFPDLKCMLLGQGSDEFNGGYSQLHLSPNQLAQQGEENRWEAFMHTMAGLEGNYLRNNVNGTLASYAPLLNKTYLADHIGYAVAQHPWQFHASMYLRNLQLYNLWHEDRTASAHSIENRVPFLDHRLVEYTMSIPPAHYKTLFWNKRILRDGFQKQLPPALLQRPKVAFFYGEDQRFTYRMLHNIMLKNNRSLIYEALGEPTQPHTVVNRQLLESYINGIGEDVEFAGVPRLLTLVNLGLLEKMLAASAFEKPAGNDAVTADRVEIACFTEQKEALSQQLGVPRPEANAGKVFKLQDDIRLLTGQDGITYIAKDNVIEYSLDEPSIQAWAQLLKLFNGQRTLQDVLHECGLPESSIQVHLEEALEYGIIETC
ncbi:MAG: asparagine synthase (glutamine-hydrolyzing) [Janthinobacterium lividum]